MAFRPISLQLIIKKEESMKVTVFGPVSVGKSSLINMLIDREDLVVGRSGIPCTRTVKSIEYEGIEFVDTPGLFSGRDTATEVREAVLNSDVALLVNRIDLAKGNIVNIQKAVELIGEDTNKPCVRFYVITDMLEINDDRHLNHLSSAVRGSKWDNMFLVHLHWKRLFKKNDLKSFNLSGIPQLRSALIALRERTG